MKRKAETKEEIAHMQVWKLVALYLDLGFLFWFSYQAPHYHLSKEMFNRLSVIYMVASTAIITLLMVITKPKQRPLP